VMRFPAIARPRSVRIMKACSDNIAMTSVGLGFSLTWLEPD
jgi:hypothetical protein